MSTLTIQKDLYITPTKPKQNPVTKSQGLVLIILSNLKGVFNFIIIKRLLFQTGSSACLKHMHVIYLVIVLIFGESCMKLIDVVKPECIVARATVSTKCDALEKVAETAKQCHLLDQVNTEDVSKALKEREKLGSTGFGQGIAIPHCRLDDVSEFVVGIMTVPKGVDFQALDDQPVKLIIFIVGPTGGADQHLKILSSISHTLLIPGVTKELLAENTSEAIRESLIRHTRADLDVTKRTTKALVEVYVQNKEKFRILLEELTAIETGSIVILDTERPAIYLAEVPLFADFWSDGVSSFSKIIRVVVEKGLVNECIRRVDVVANGLDHSSEIMVLVQQPTCALGSLY